MILKAEGKFIDTKPIERIFTQGEKYSDIIGFLVPAQNNDVDVSECTFVLRTVACEGSMTETLLSVEHKEDDLLLSWNVPETAMAVPGMLELELIGSRGSDVIIKYMLPAIYVKKSVLGDHAPPPDLFEQKLAEVNTLLEKTKEKLEEIKNANIKIDATLTHENEAADAKATGDRLKELEADIIKLEAEIVKIEQLQQQLNILRLKLDIVLPYLVNETGSCGENTEYSICEDETLHVAGADIDDYAFQNHDNFTAVDVNITGKIGVWAFAGCSHLSFAEVNCREIGDGAFTGCQQLKWLTIGKSVQKIGAEILRQVGSLYGSSVRVMYAGTITEWAAIEKAANWIGEMVTVENGVIICSDGTVEV